MKNKTESEQNLSATQIKQSWFSEATKENQSRFLCDVCCVQSQSGAPMG